VNTISPIRFINAQDFVARLKVRVVLEDVGFAYVNGEFLPRSKAKISIFDHGFLYGHGVYDTMVVKNGSIFKLNEHINRLFRSAKVVKIEIPMSERKFREVVVETVRRSGLADAYVKCIVTRGIGKTPLLGGEIATPSLVVFAVPPVSVVPLEKVEKGAKVVSTTIKRLHHMGVDPRVKSLNYLPNMLMRLEAIECGADEAISYDYNGYVTEGGAENIFVIKEKIFKTPAKGILEGITRDTVIEIAKTMGYKVEKTDLAKYDLYTADEVFLCSTAGGIFPVTFIDGRKIGEGQVGSITKTIVETYEHMLREGTHGTPL